MPVGLLPIIYLAFISLGLPDSAIGSAWPVMAGDLHAGISWVGAVTMIISLGTIFSSFMSVRVVERLGTGRVTVLSVVLTAAALVGFSLAQEFWQLCVLAVPYGLGAGAVDAALTFLRALATRITVPIRLVDERFTTVQAHSVLQSAGRNSKQRRDRVDSVAAVLILQTALDLEKSSGTPAGTILDRED